MFAIKLLALYLLAYVLQRPLRLMLDQHVGNFVVNRISKQSLLSIFFFENFGMPIMALSMALQQDFFKEDLKKYRSFHICFTSFLPPLTYLFVYTLTLNDTLAFVAALLYATTFCLPATVNQLVQPEHYELFFFLLGGTIVCHSAPSNEILLLLGFAVLGLTQLCKLPALASLWMLGMFLFPTIVPSHLITSVPKWEVLAAYVAPMIGFYVLRSLLMIVMYRSKNASVSGLTSIFKRVVGTYAYYHQTDRKGNLKKNLIMLQDFLCEFAPLLFLASLGFFYSSHETTTMLIATGLISCSLIFLLRFTFSFYYSIHLFLCIAAGLGGILFVEHFDFLKLFILFWTFVISIKAIMKHPFHIWIFGLPRGIGILDHLMYLGDWIRENSPEGSLLFANINHATSFLYLTAQRPLPSRWSALLMGVFAPKVTNTALPEFLKEEGRQIVDGFSKLPPLLILQSKNADIWPIINMSYLCSYLQIDYQVYAQANDFLLFVIQSYDPAYVPHEPLDFNQLFDVDLARAYLHTIPCEEALTFNFE